MRTLALVSLLVLASSFASLPAAAASGGGPRQGSFAVSLVGGLSVPVGQIARKADLTANVGDSGLDLQPGANYGASLDYFLTDRVAVGAFVGDGTLHMRDFTAATGSGDVTVKDMVKGRTTVAGGAVKLYFPSRRPWTPYAFAGAAQFRRVGEISRDVLKFFPGTSVFELTDTAIGYNAGVGGEYLVRHGLAVGVMGGYWYSGKLTHTFHWSGDQTIVHDWSFWTGNATVTARFPTGD